MFCFLHYFELNAYVALKLIQLILPAEFRIRSNSNMSRTMQHAAVFTSFHKYIVIEGTIKMMRGVRSRQYHPNSGTSNHTAIVQFYH